MVTARLPPTVSQISKKARVREREREREVTYGALLSPPAITVTSARFKVHRCYEYFTVTPI